MEELMLELLVLVGSLELVGLEVIEILETISKTMLVKAQQTSKAKGFHYPSTKLLLV